MKSRREADGYAHAAGRWIVRPSDRVISSGNWQRLDVSRGMFLYKDAKSSARRKSRPEDCKSAMGSPWQITLQSFVFMFALCHMTA